MTREAHVRVPFVLALTAAFAFVAGGPAQAQPLTERPPNLEGTWTPGTHDLFFGFSHRFQITGQDSDISDLFGDGKVVNYPTFLLSYAFWPGTALGVRYSSNSAIAGLANEWQPYVKWTPLRAGEEGGLSASVLGGWNGANDSFDGELMAQFDRERYTLIAGLRGFSSPFDRPSDEAELALAGGATLRLNRFLAFSADYANMVTQSDAQIGWSAGAAIQIPYTPHTFALFATNVTSGTLEGASVGIDGTTFWGFEFTIRFAGERWGEIFDPSQRGDPRAPGAAADTADADDVVVIEIQGLSFGREELTVAPGTTVRWVNRDPVAHTATSDDGLWGSPLVEPGASWEHTFEEPGTFPYHCEPHPFMQATITVTGSDTPN